MNRDLWRRALGGVRSPARHIGRTRYRCDVAVVHPSPPPQPGESEGGGQRGRKALDACVCRAKGIVPAGPDRVPRQSEGPLRQTRIIAAVAGAIAPRSDHRPRRGNARAVAAGGASAQRASSRSSRSSTTTRRGWARSARLPRARAGGFERAGQTGSRTRSPASAGSSRARRTAASPACSRLASGSRRSCMPPRRLPVARLGAAASARADSGQRRRRWATARSSTPPPSSSTTACRLAVHVGPGAPLGGLVTVRTDAHIGMGAVVIEGVRDRGGRVRRRRRRGQEDVARRRAGRRRAGAADWQPSSARARPSRPEPRCRRVGAEEHLDVDARMAGRAAATVVDVPDVELDPRRPARARSAPRPAPSPSCRADLETSTLEVVYWSTW